MSVCRCSSCSFGFWKLCGNFYPAEQHSLNILYLDPTRYIYCLAVLMNDCIYTDETRRAFVIWMKYCDHGNELFYLEAM